jgi:hypothetical protein
MCPCIPIAVHTTGGYSSNSGTLLYSSSPHYHNVLIWAGLKDGTPIADGSECRCQWWQFICRLIYRCTRTRLLPGT